MGTIAKHDNSSEADKGDRIKFTHEDETDGCISSLKTFVVRQTDGKCEVVSASEVDAYRPVFELRLTSPAVS